MFWLVTLQYTRQLGPNMTPKLVVTKRLYVFGFQATKKSTISTYNNINHHEYVWNEKCVWNISYTILMHLVDQYWTIILLGVKIDQSTTYNIIQIHNNAMWD